MYPKNQLQLTFNDKTVQSRSVTEVDLADLLVAMRLLPSEAPPIGPELTRYIHGVEKNKYTEMAQETNWGTGYGKDVQDGPCHGYVAAGRWVVIGEAHAWFSQHFRDDASRIDAFDFDALAERVAAEWRARVSRDLEPVLAKKAALEVQLERANAIVEEASRQRRVQQRFVALTLDSEQQ